MGCVRIRHFRAWAADALAVTILELWAAVGKSLRGFRSWRKWPKGIQEPRGGQEEPKNSPRGGFLEARGRKCRSQGETHKNVRKIRVPERLRGAQKKPKVSQDSPRGGQEEPKRSPKGAKRSPRGAHEDFFWSPEADKTSPMARPAKTLVKQVPERPREFEDRVRGW